MKFSYYKFILIFIVLTSFQSYSQSGGVIDSLKHELGTCQNRTDSVRILCRLSWNISTTNIVETKKYGVLALKKAKGLNDSALISEAYDAAALGFWINDNTPKAKEYYETALDIGRRNNLPERIAFGCYNLAQIAINEGQFTKAKELTEEGRKQFKKLKKYDFILYSNQRKLKTDALSGFSEATVDTFIADVSGFINEVQDSVLLLQAYLSLANLYSQIENKSLSLRYIQKAMELAETMNNIKGITRTYNIIGDYFRDEVKNYEVALIYYKKVISLLEDDELALVKADLYQQVGSVYQLMMEDSLAMSYYLKSLNIGKKLKHNHTQANAYRCIGEICYQNNQYEDALSYFLKSYDIRCDQCPEIKFHKVLIDVGNVYLHMNDYGKARLYYQKSLDLANIFESYVDKAVSLQHLGKYYNVTGNKTKSIRNYNEAFDLACNTNTLYLQRDISKELAEMYVKTGNYKKAYELQDISAKIKDSLDMISKADNIAQLETKFEFQNLQMQKELELKENKIKTDAEIKKQSQQKQFFIFGFIMMTILGIAIYNGYRRKRRDNRILELQKKQLESMSAEVHKADQAKLQFFTNISHEFKTPLTLILGMTEKMKSLLKDNSQILTIRKNSLKLLQLVNHLLDLRKIDTLNMKLGVQKGSINAFIKGAVGSFQDIARQKNINIVFHSGNGDIEGYFDYDKIEKVVWNLLSNALKYTNRNGLVEIHLNRNNEGYLIVDIRDNGIGISEKEIRHIFNRFYRVSENSNQGSGIGLALVKELIELHKGEISVKSDINGSVFSFQIPIEERFYSPDEISKKENTGESWNYADILEIEEEEINEKYKHVHDSEQKTILIVEDNQDLRRYISDIFTNNYRVLEAKDGNKGYSLAEEYVPDIVISDIMMPGISGLELVEKIKNNMATSHIPVILLTAKNDLGTRLSSFEKGADEYISKPFDTVILKSRVENLLRIRKQLVEKFSKEFHLQPREINIENADQKFLQKSIDIIEKYISNPNLNVDLLAMELGVSRTQLYRKLNALTDYAPKQFIRVIRLKRAAQILQQGQNNIAEVMDATGFSNYSFFNNCFKELFGKYPKEYTVINVKGNLN